MIVDSVEVRIKAQNVEPTKLNWLKGRVDNKNDLGVILVVMDAQ